MTTAESTTDLRRTALADVHEALGARLVPFAGFLMPLQYLSIRDEHHAVRRAAGIFDVSHMGEFLFEGPRALEAIQHVTVNDAAKLQIDQAQYSAMVDENGGLIDDCVVYRLARERYLMVVNASNIAKDWDHIRRHASGGFELTDRSEETTLLAVQGPRAVEAIAPLADISVAEIPYYWKRDGRIVGVATIISRTGYTGEDGFELYLDRANSELVWEAILSAGSMVGLRPCGLGARDTLRLEMKYPLYGSDIDETVNPYEAGLGWIVKLDQEGDFVGRDALTEIAEQGPARRLVGFRLNDRGVPRPGYAVALEGEPVAEVRSGAMSPTLGYGIGTCYLPKGHTRPGTPIGVIVRDRELHAEVAKTPFYSEGSLKR